MKAFNLLVICVFVLAGMASAQRVKIYTTELFSKNEVRYPNKSDSMPSYLVYDTVEYAQDFPFNYYKKHKGFKSYEFTLIGWFLKTEKIATLYPFEKFVQCVIIDKVERTQANYPFVERGDGLNGLNEVLYIGRIHMDLNPKGYHDYIHYTGYLKNGIPDYFGSFDHLTLNVKALMLEECLYKGSISMAKRNGEGCYSNGRPEVDRSSLEYERSSRSSGMDYPNVRYGIPIVSICGTFNMDTLVYARYAYEDGSSFTGAMDMPYEFPSPYLHYSRDFELKGNGSFTRSDGTKVTGRFQYPYMYVNGQRTLVANPNNIKREEFVSASYKLCQVCGGGGLINKGVTTSGGAVVLEKKDLGNNYVQYSATRNAPTTFYSLKNCSSCTNGRVKTSEGYMNRVSIKN